MCFGFVISTERYLAEERSRRHRARVNETRYNVVTVLQINVFDTELRMHSSRQVVVRLAYTSDFVAQRLSSENKLPP